MLDTKSDCRRDWLWVRTLLEEMKYLFKIIFPFIRSGVEAERGNLAESRERSVLTLGSLWLPCGGRDIAYFFKFLILEVQTNRRYKI